MSTFNEMFQKVLETKLQKETIEKCELSGRIGQVVEDKGHLEERVKYLEKQLDISNSNANDLQQKLDHSTAQSNDLEKQLQQVNFNSF